MTGSEAGYQERVFAGEYFLTTGNTKDTRRRLWWIRVQNRVERRGFALPLLTADYRCGSVTTDPMRCGSVTTTDPMGCDSVTTSKPS